VTGRMAGISKANVSTPRSREVSRVWSPGSVRGGQGGRPKNPSVGHPFELVLGCRQEASLASRCRHSKPPWPLHPSIGVPHEGWSRQPGSRPTGRSDICIVFFALPCKMRCPKASCRRTSPGTSASRTGTVRSSRRGRVMRLERSCGRCRAIGCTRCTPWRCPWGCERRGAGTEVVRCRSEARCHPRPPGPLSGWREA
jgi:hypothetical protein